MKPIKSLKVVPTYNCPLLQKKLNPVPFNNDDESNFNHIYHDLDDINETVSISVSIICVFVNINNNP